MFGISDCVTKVSREDRGGVGRGVAGGVAGERWRGVRGGAWRTSHGVRLRSVHCGDSATADAFPLSPTRSQSHLSRLSTLQTRDDVGSLATRRRATMLPLP